MSTMQTPIGREVASARVRSGGARRGTNVGKTERWLSLLGAGALAVTGAKRRDLPGLGMATLGAALAYRGLTGHCHLYSAMGVNTAPKHGRAASVAAGRGVKVVHAVKINRPADQLYRVWRDFEQLPRFMKHLVSVKNEGKFSHWVARGPAGTTVEWGAEIINEEPNRLIAWRSLAGSRVNTAGSVTFTPASDNRGTEVRVTLKYDPPAGKIGGWVAWLFGQEPSVQVRDDLLRFKQLMEGGAGQSRQRV